MIAIVDYRMGNLRSVQKGFEHVGVPALVTGDPEVIAAAHGIVLPGVGAFRAAASNLRASGLSDIIRARIEEGTPFLGICLGLQLLATVGLEEGEWEGLGVVPGRCERLRGGVKVPHIGWNSVKYPRDSILFAGIPENTSFYFVHSYHLVPEDASCIIGTTEHGGVFAAAVQAGPCGWAVQFHPEKSSEAGLRLLGNFGSFVEGNAV